MKLGRRTERLFQADMFLGEAVSSVVRVGPDYIELASTVAYPEGGGQEADSGTLGFADGLQLRFASAKKMYGHLAGLPEFPDVMVGGVIWHMLEPQDCALLQFVQPAATCQVRIDVDRRARLSLSHTASHLLYLAIGQHRPDAIANTLGCHIRVDGARFDFGVENRFSPEDLAMIEATANGFVQRDARITFSAHEDEPDARRWHCEGQVIACGGTHWDRSACVGPLKVTRKRLGSNKERIACALAEPRLDLHRYQGGCL